MVGAEGEEKKENTKEDEGIVQEGYIGMGKGIKQILWGRG